MKKLFSYLAAVCLLAGFASASVAINAPTEGATYSFLHTSVKGDTSITTLEEWIDGVKVYQTVKCAPNCVIERDESLANGSHYMTIVGKTNGRVVSKQRIDFSINNTSTPPPPTSPSSNVLYQEDYTNGLGAIGLYAPYGQCAATAGSNQLWKDGHIEQHYILPANACSDHTDANMPIQYILPGGKGGAGVPEICRKEDYTFVTPTGSKQIQRKMMWLNAGYNSASTNPMWELVLTTDGSPTTGRPSVRFGYQDALSQGYSLYGADADPGFVLPMPDAYNGGIFEFEYDRKYTVEFCAKRKTPGIENSEIHLYIDGQEVFRKTTWGGVRNKAAFPVNDFDPSNFTATWGGQQTDRIGIDKAVDEYRIIDNTVICIGKC